MEGQAAPQVVKKLIEENGDPTEEYVSIITQIFKRFDRDEDGILNLREFNGMLHASGEEATDKHTYGGLLMMFEDVDDDKVGRRPTGVSLKGFIQMSVLSTVEVISFYLHLQKLNHPCKLIIIYHILFIFIMIVICS